DRVVRRADHSPPAAVRKRSPRRGVASPGTGRRTASRTRRDAAARPRRPRHDPPAVARLDVGFAALAEEPVVVDMADRPWEAWPDALVEERGGISWKTLVSADQTRSEALTFGVARLPPRACLREHHHAQAEVYFVLARGGRNTACLRHQPGLVHLGVDQLGLRLRRGQGAWPRPRRVAVSP